MRMYLVCVHYHNGVFALHEQTTKITFVKISFRNIGEKSVKSVKNVLANYICYGYLLRHVKAFYLLYI